MKVTFWARSFFIFALAMGGAAVGSSAHAQAEQPDALVEAYSNWTVRCQTQGQNGARACNMRQELVAETPQGQVRNLMNVVITRSDDGAGVITMITPLGVDLRQSVGISVGDLSIETNFLTCRRFGCIIQEDLDESVVSAMRVGDVAALSVALVNGRTIEAALSLAGFTAAWNRLQEL